MKTLYVSDLDGAFTCYSEEGDKWTAGRNSVDRVQWCVYSGQSYR